MTDDSGSPQGSVVENEETPPASLIRETFSALIGRSGPAHHPIFDKFETEHVTQFLENVHARDQDNSRFKRSNRWFRLTYVLIAVAVLGAFTAFLLPEQADLYFKVLQGIGIFAAGLAGGYGLKSYQDQSRP